VDSRGFTLIETLIVLSIVAVITTVTMFEINPKMNRFDNHLFLTQLQSDFYFAQQYAISHQQELTVVFDLQQKRYYIRGKFDSAFTVVEKQFPPKVSVKYGSLPLTFKILPDGNVSHFGSLYIYIDRKEYKLTFLLGKGRFYIVET
jgi:competence protein ComGD